MNTLRDIATLRKFLEIVELARKDYKSNTISIDFSIMENLFQETDTDCIVDEVNQLFPDYQISSEFIIDQGDPRREIPDLTYYKIQLNDIDRYFNLLHKAGIKQLKYFTIDNPTYRLSVGLTIDSENNFLTWNGKSIKMSLTSSKQGIFLYKLLQSYPLPVSVNELYVDLTGGDKSDSVKSEAIGDIRNNLINRLINGLKMTRAETDQLIVLVPGRGYKIGCKVELVNQP